MRTAMNPLLRPIAGCLFALAATVALAQTPPPLVVPQQDEPAATALPIVNHRSGQVEAFLLIEGPSASRPRSTLDRLLGRDAGSSAGAGLVIPLDNGRRASVSLAIEGNPTLGLLCDNSALARTVGTLAQHCLVAKLDGGPATPLALSQPGVRAQARLEGERSAVTASIGLTRFDTDQPMQLPGTLAGTGQPLMLSLAGAGIEQQDIALSGELQLGDSVWVSIGGTLARARVVPAQALPGGVTPRWNAGSLSVGGGIGNFGGEIVGRVIEIPGAERSYSNVGLGLTWRAPWRARLSVGAENLMSRGQNPFTHATDEDGDEGRVPYIRYEQDL